MRALVSEAQGEGSSGSDQDVEVPVLGSKGDGDRREFILSLRGIVTKFVNKHLEDPKKEMFRLATGRCKDCPFTDQALRELREEWFKLLGDSPNLREVPPHQPFFLAAIE
ncbi:unnamed protein product, partial [Symbiodinium microadriaticum]